MKKTLFYNLKKTQSMVIALLLCSVTLTSCLFDTDDNGLESWLADRGMPSSYQVQILSIDGLKVSSAQAYFNKTPRAADGTAVFGHASNITHDLVFDLTFEAKSTFMEKFNESDSSGAFLGLFWLNAFYDNKNFPSDSLPLDEEVEVSVSWKLESTDSMSYKNFFRKVTDVDDSTWYNSLIEWDADGIADTTYNVKLTKDMLKAKEVASIRMDLPSALVEDLKKVKGAAHLQLRLSAPKAAHIYRFYGDGTSRPPVFEMFSDSTTFVAPNPFRMANVLINEEECSECPILHAGTYDSLVFELPPEPILEALSEYYGDEFPYTKGDGNDVRQVVVHAQLTMARDDSKGNSELGFAIQMLNGSYVDSADTKVRRVEKYRLDTTTIMESGHPNLLFIDGDSLTIQLTYGLRDFLNKASDGRNMKFMMRMGLPYLQVKDTTYQDYVKSWKDTIKTAKGDSIVTRSDTLYQYFNYFDYARYDFSTSMENPMTLKLWLASKREDD